MTGGAVFGTWGVWLPASDPLWKYCDAAIHWECYATWPNRKRFASTYFEFWVKEEENDPFWHRAYLTDDVLVTINPSEPIKSAWVHLKETGERISVKLGEWEQWLADDSKAGINPVSALAINPAKRAMKKDVATVDQLLKSIDVSRKRQVIEQFMAARSRNGKEKK